MTTSGEGPNEAALDAIWEAYERAVEEIRAAEDPDEARRAAYRLADEIGRVQGASVQVKYDAVRRLKDELGLSLKQLGAHLGVTKSRAQAIYNAAGGKDEEAAVPEPMPVVAAIVTSRLGVLVGRRNDGKPPWTFIAGEIEPGESPEDAGVREVKEETGLAVKAGRILGRRVHPKTGRTMVYMSARPARATATEVFVGDEDELAEVRWISLAEADELLPGMFEPVRAYLGRALRGRA